MIEVQKVIKENGELSMTRKHAFTVEDRDEMEREREKLQKHYGCKIYLVFREI